jgi:hypothetical protein
MRLRDTCTFWPATGWDDYGKPTWGDPVQVSCFWQNVSEAYIGPDGTTHMSRAIVDVAVDMPLGSLLLHSPLGEVLYPSDPKASGAWEIMKFDVDTDVTVRRTWRTAFL